MGGSELSTEAPEQSSRGTPWLAVVAAGVFLVAAAYAAVAVGVSSAATVGVDSGNNWFCNASYQNGVCDTFVNVGDTVSWDVVEGVHTVTECDDGFTNCGGAGHFDSGNLNTSSAPYTQNFAAPGTYEYLCELHNQQMRGRVVVSAGTSTPVATPTPSPSPTPTPTPYSPYAAQTIVNTGKTLLTDIALLPDAPNLAVVTTQDGDLWRVNLWEPQATPEAFGNVRDRMTRIGDEGLLSVGFDPENPGELYINFTTGTQYYRPYNNGPVTPTPTMPANPKRNRVARYNVGPAGIDLASEEVIYESLRPGHWHTLGDMLFDSTGNLYVGSGDGGDTDAHFDPDGGQGVSNDLATIIRIDPNDGAPGHAIPAGNPFDDGAGPNANQVWAYGLRVPWRISFDRQNGELWTGDVGQHNAEEVNHVVSGGNYGWSIMEGVACHVAGCTPPANHIPPRTWYCNYFCPTSDDCAIVGGFVYRGQGMPDLDGWYIYADFCTGRIRAVDTESTAPAVELLNTDMQPVSFVETADGELLILDFNGSIRLLTLNGDTDGDGDLDPQDNCPSIYNPAQADADTDSLGDQCDTGDADGDGYGDANEVRSIGTGAGDPCGWNGWPSNVQDAGSSANKLDINDIVSFLGPTRRLDKSPGQIGFDSRWDLAPGKGGLGSYINIQDVTSLLSGPTGNPPMFNGTRAFGKVCPFPP